MTPEDISKVVVITPFGLFEYIRMPFGLRNAAQSFQRQDVRQWAKTCLSFQASKAHKYNCSPLACFPLPKARFRHIHVNIVGPLPPSSSFIYILTCIDRYTRWPIAVPLRDTFSASVAKALIESWISIFGVPSFITTDRRSKVASSLLRQLNQPLSSTHICTTTYHPEANGLVEPFSPTA
nr:pol polyprotein [Hymenolepis microstoma]